MNNSINPWSVPFSRTKFLLEILSSHGNVTELRRERDIFFTFRRASQGDSVRLLGGDAYVFSLALVRRALSDFGELEIIYVGGKWNGYSAQAKQFCLDEGIGLFNAGELSGSLWSDDYCRYAKTDDQGNPSYPIKDGR